MSYESQMELAEKIRGKSLTPIEFDEAYIAYEREQHVDSIAVPTRHGDTTVYIHTPDIIKEPKSVFINIHGGGFVRPLIDTNIRFCNMLAVRTGSIVLDIDYLLAPEHKYPVAVEQVYDTVKWIFEHAGEFGVDKSRICIGGHSAGANLSLVTCMKAAQTGEFMPRFMMLDFCCVDMDTSPDKKPDWEHNIIPLDRAKAFNELYTDDDPKITQDPYCSPKFAPDEWLKDLPDTLVITGGKDAFRFEMEEFAGRMIAQGVKVTVRRFKNSDHGFTVNCKGMWREAQDLIVKSIEQLDAADVEG